MLFAGALACLQLVHSSRTASACVRIGMLPRVYFVECLSTLMVLMQPYALVVHSQICSTMVCAMCGAISWTRLEFALAASCTCRRSPHRRRMLGSISAVLGLGSLANCSSTSQCAIQGRRGTPLLQPQLTQPQQRKVAVTRLTGMAPR